MKATREKKKYRVYIVHGCEKRKGETTESKKQQKDGVTATHTIRHIYTVTVNHTHTNAHKYTD